MDLDAEVDALFALPPEEFVARRDELVRRLRDDGLRDDVSHVKQLRRPTVVAWAINQLSRSERARVEELIASGADLRAAQRKTLSGVKDSGFRDAAERRRVLVRSLTSAATSILGDRGGADADEEIARTLEAASVDDGAAEELLRGRLTKPLAAAGGFEALTGFEVIPAPAGDDEDDGGTEEAERHARETARRNAERQATEAEAEARRAAMRAEALEEQATEVARRAEEARREAEELTREADAARERLEKLEG